MTLTSSSSSSIPPNIKSNIDASSFHEHNMLVYPDLDTFTETYCMYAKIHLQPKHNEIVLIVTQYQTIEKVRENLREFGIDVDKHEKDGSLIIIDSVEGYQSDKDHTGVFKLAQSLVLRAEKEGKGGVCVFGDVGSFFMYDRITELLQYELSIPRKPPIKLKAFCSYHAGDYGRLTEEQKGTLAKNHYRRLMPQTN
jgi:DcmR-like sensory protein